MRSEELKSGAASLECHLSYVFLNMKGFICSILQLKLDVAFGVVLHGWHKDCVGLA
jgi:hypothetical protein